MNQVRDADAHPELAVNPGALNAMGLIDEALHFVDSPLSPAARPTQPAGCARLV